MYRIFFCLCLLLPGASVAVGGSGIGTRYVLFLDGNAAGQLGLRPSSSLTEALSAGDGQMEDQALDDLLMLHDSGLRLVVAGRRAGAEFGDDPAMLGTVLERLKERFDYVVADTGIAPPTAGGYPLAGAAVVRSSSSPM